MSERLSEIEIPGNLNIPLQLYIVTGLSGAGKSQAIHYFEDAGFFCIDNLSHMAKFSKLL